MEQLIVGLIIISLIVWWMKHLLESRQLPPGPTGLPILGFLPWIDKEKPYETFTELSRKYGSLYSLKLGKVLAVVSTDSKIIKKALAKEAFAGRANLYLTHGIMRGYGIVCAEGERWKQQRRFMITCLKNFGMVKYGSKREQLQTRIIRGVDEFLQLIKANENEEVDVLPLLLHCIGNIINDLVTGRTWQQNDPKWQKLMYLAEEGVKHIGVAGPLNFLPFLSYLPKYRKVMNFLLDGMKETHSHYDEIFESCVDLEAANLTAAFKKEMLNGRQNEQIFSRTQLHYFLADSFGAGLDTTVSTFTWFLLFMAIYPDIQLKLQENIDQVYYASEKGAKIQLSLIESLPLLEASMAETERIRPIVPVGFPRGSTEDTFLENYFIPKGTMFMPLIWAVHTDAKFWKEPFVFNPFRFINQDGRFYKPDHFIPFQSGKRICVGEELSRMMLFLFAANLLKEFSISVSAFSDDNKEQYLEGHCGIIFTPKCSKLIFKTRN